MTALGLLAGHYGDDELAAGGPAGYLVTLGEDDWPHAAMVSVGEVVVRANGSCALALWDGTRTTSNLLRTGRATLLTVLSEHAIRAQLQLEAAPEVPDLPGSVALRCFSGTVSHAAAETAPYARIVDGVRFVLLDPKSALPRWRATRAVLHALLSDRPRVDP